MIDAQVATSSPEIARYHVCQQIAAISPARAVTVATHARTKLYTENVN